MPEGGKFAGKVAIVTGGAGGIGGAISRHFAELGCQVLLGDIDPRTGAQTALDIGAAGGEARFLEMDLGRPGDAQRTIEAALEAFGRLDILINCAAVLGVEKPMLELDLEEWEFVIRTNLTGTFLFSQAAARQMLKQAGGGAIVNILAIQAYMPLPGRGPYSASKGGLATMTRALAVELAGKGIRVNGIAVGSVYTEGVRDALALQSSEAPPDVDASAATLVGRMGRPMEIARVAAFLASEDASYLAGAIVPAEGGRLLSRKADPFLAAQAAQGKPS
jgi:NAD(P)-dependent dehydrogenase (short-subunit alcohol dehydrogenase family)